MLRRRDHKYWTRMLSVGAVGGLLILLIEYVVMGSHWLAYLIRSPLCCVTPADGGLVYETVTLTAADGVALDGWYIPSTNRAAVILLHGYGSNRLQMMVRAAMLARHGYGALLYDMRAQGRSGGKVASNGWQDLDDVEAALDYLRARPDVDPDRIGIVGFSVGGQVALRAAARYDNIRAVVADGPSTAVIEDFPPVTSLYDRFLWGTQWLIQRALSIRAGVPIPPGVTQAVPAIAPRPLLIIAAGQAEMELEIARHFYELAGEPKDLWGIPEAGHGEGPTTRPAEYEDRLVTFFDESLAQGR